MSGAPADFERLYRAEIDYVVRTLRRLGAAPADLEDLTHDVFVVAYRRRADRCSTPRSRSPRPPRSTAASRSPAPASS